MDMSSVVGFGPSPEMAPLGQPEADGIADMWTNVPSGFA